MQLSRGPLLLTRLLISQSSRSVSSSCKLWSSDDGKPKNKPTQFQPPSGSRRTAGDVQAKTLTNTLRKLKNEKKDDTEGHRGTTMPGVKDKKIGLRGLEDGLMARQLPHHPIKEDRKPQAPKVLLSDAKRLGIFEKPDAEAKAAAKSRRLNLLEEDEKLWIKNWNRLKPTNNEFETLMEQPGYQYPIDNEVVKQSEANIGFQDHVLLDHLISDLPKKGPVRKFMQLVISGLSKSPYFTVKEKREHIQWYKNIFRKMSDDEVREMLASRSHRHKRRKLARAKAVKERAARTKQKI